MGSVHTSVVFIASAIFAMVFLTPEMIFMNIMNDVFGPVNYGTFSVANANVLDTLLVISAVFSDNTVLNFNKKIFFKNQKKKKKPFTVRPDKMVSRMRTSKQFFFVFCFGCLYSFSPLVEGSDKKIVEFVLKFIDRMVK